MCTACDLSLYLPDKSKQCARLDSLPIPSRSPLPLLRLIATVAAALVRAEWCTMGIAACPCVYIVSLSIDFEFSLTMIRWYMRNYFYFSFCWLLGRLLNWRLLGGPGYGIWTCCPSLSLKDHARQDWLWTGTRASWVCSSGPDTWHLPRVYVIRYSKLADVTCFSDTPGWYLDEEGTWDIGIPFNSAVWCFLLTFTCFPMGEV